MFKFILNIILAQIIEQWTYFILLFIARILFIHYTHIIQS